MNKALDLLVFTDLDGTLIDHDTYAWDAAREALAALARLAAGVVLASSKTASEMSTIRSGLGLDDWPAIVENGAGLLPAHARAVTPASRYAALREALAGVPPDLRDHFEGFGDMSVGRIAEMTGLAHKAAARAKRRDFSEPGLWSGTHDQRQDFLSYLNTLGITAQQGGRFLTLSFGGNKSDQMRILIARYNPRHTIALGDAPNDIEMLECADIGVIVANPHHAPLPHLAQEAHGHIIRTKAAGPSGWNEAILALLTRLDLQ